MLPGGLQGQTVVNLIFCFHGGGGRLKIFHCNPSQYRPGLYL